MRASCVLAVAVVAWTAAAARADAPPRVEVRAIADQPLPPELIDTLRIYLGSAAAVELGPPLTATTLDARIAEASAGLVPGSLVTWLERPPGADGSYTVVVVGERGGRAAVEVGVLDGPDTAAISRLLALRIGAFLDETIAAGPASPLATAPLRLPPASLAPRPPPRRIGAIAEVGAGAMIGSGVDGEGAIGLGARLRATGHVVEAVAIGRLGWPRTQRAATGDSVELAATDLAASARFLVTGRRAWVGAALDLGARRIRADGMTVDGVRGSAVQWMPIARVAVDARVVLGAVSLRATLGIERALGPEQFTVRGTEVATAGRLALVSELGLTIPLGF